MSTYNNQVTLADSQELVTNNTKQDNYLVKYLITISLFIFIFLSFSLCGSPNVEDKNKQENKNLLDMY